MKLPLPKLPSYRSHKIVQAAPITRIQWDADIPSWILTLDVPAPAICDRIYVRVSPEWARSKMSLAPNAPSGPWADGFEPDLPDLGVFVIYEDGFTSWSPSKAFDGGYDLIVDD